MRTRAPLDADGRKPCLHCGLRKPEADFVFNRTYGRYANVCKPCRARQVAKSPSRTTPDPAGNRRRYLNKVASGYTRSPQFLAAKARWRANNPEKVRAAHRRVYRKNPLRIKRWKQANATRVALSNRRSKLKAKGLTLMAFNALYAAQAGACAICLTPTPLGKIGVDHCHRTGTPRKLLCSLCNSLLGFARDDPALLRAAIAYLEEYTEPTRETEGARSAPVADGTTSLDLDRVRAPLPPGVPPPKRRSSETHARKKARHYV